MSIPTNKYRITVLGIGGVGKTSIINRYVNDTFLDIYESSVEGIYHKDIKLEGEHIQLEISDTGSQEDFYYMLDKWINLADGVLLVYDIRNIDSINELEWYYNKINVFKKIPILLVENKYDLPYNINPAIITYLKELAENWNCNIIISSAKLNINISEAFTLLAKKIRIRKIKIDRMKKLTAEEVKVDCCC